MQNNFGYNFDSPPTPPRGWTKDGGKQKAWTQLALDKVMLSTERSDVQECPPALTLSWLHPPCFTPSVLLLGLQRFAEVGNKGRPERCMMCSAARCLLFLQGGKWSWTGAYCLLSSGPWEGFSLVRKKESAFLFWRSLPFE